MFLFFTVLAQPQVHHHGHPSGCHSPRHRRQLITSQPPISKSLRPFGMDCIGSLDISAGCSALRSVRSSKKNASLMDNNLKKRNYGSAGCMTSRLRKKCVSNFSSRIFSFQSTMRYVDTSIHLRSRKNILNPDTPNIDAEAYHLARPGNSRWSQSSVGSHPVSLVSCL